MLFVSISIITPRSERTARDYALKLESLSFIFPSSLQSRCAQVCSQLPGACNFPCIQFTSYLVNQMLRIIICCCFWNCPSAAVALVSQEIMVEIWQMLCLKRSQREAAWMHTDVWGLWFFFTTSLCCLWALSQDSLGLVPWHIHGGVCYRVTRHSPCTSFWSKNLNQTFGVKTNLNGFMTETHVCFFFCGVNPLKGICFALHTVTSMCADTKHSQRFR